MSVDELLFLGWSERWVEIFSISIIMREFIRISWSIKCGIVCMEFSEEWQLDRNIKDLFSILIFHLGIAKLGEFQHFCESHNIPKKEGVAGLKTVLRGMQEQHLHELDNNGPDLLNLEASSEYMDSIGRVDRPKRSLAKPFDVLARFALESFLNLQSKTLEEITSNVNEMFSNYVMALGTYFSDNVQFNNGDLKLKLRIQSVKVFADILLNPSYGVLYDHCSPSAVMKGRKEYITRIWKGYAGAIAFIYSYAYEPVFCDSRIEKILEAQNENDAFVIYNGLEELAEKRIEQDFGHSGSIFSLSETPDSSPLLELVSEISFQDKRGETEKMDELFSQKPTTLFDCRSKVYAGPATLIRLIIGEVEIKKKHRSDENPVRIIRFTHPAPEHSGNRYSYAILIEDGWLVFYWACNDFSGSSKGVWLQIEQEIDANSKHIEYTVTPPLSIDDLKAYVVGKKIEEVKKLDNKVDLTEEEAIPFLFQNASQLSERIAGLLLEFVVVVLLTRSGILVDWALRDDVLKDIEVDMVAFSDDSCWIIECSHRLSSDLDKAKKLVDRFDRRQEAIPKIERYKNKTVKRIYVTRRKYSDNLRMKEVLELLESKQISVRFFEDCLSDSKLHREDIERIDGIMSELDAWRPKETGVTSGSFIRDLVLFYQHGEPPPEEFFLPVAKDEI